MRMWKKWLRSVKRLFVAAPARKPRQKKAPPQEQPQWSTGRPRYVPTPEAGTWQDIIAVLTTHHRAMTRDEINRLIDRQTGSIFLPEMVRVGVLHEIRGYGKYLYVLSEWDSEELRDVVKSDANGSSYYPSSKVN